MSTAAHGTADMATNIKIQPRALVRASGGPRYVVALAVDALGTGLLRPFLLLYGVTVLRLSASATGIAMTVGIVIGLVCMPAVGRWLDRGARSPLRFRRCHREGSGRGSAVAEAGREQARELGNRLWRRLEVAADVLRHLHVDTDVLDPPPFGPASYPEPDGLLPA
ncbi:hypothetical protein [Micromonospora sp. NPDC004704]